MSGTKHFRVYLPRIVAGLVIVAAAYFVYDLIKEFAEKRPVKNDKKIQPITLLKPPPPPPPPPKVEKPPEPKVEEKIEQPKPEPEPEPLPDTPPDDAPAKDLGIDADASAGSDGFGLRARKGGNGLFGGGGNPYGGYGTMVKNDVLRLLHSHDDLRRKAYSTIVKLWLKPDGAIERFELVKGSNDAEIDSTLNRVLQGLAKVSEPPPPGMPQPIKLKISSRV